MLTEKLHLQSNELHGLSILDDGRTQVSGIAINPGKYHGLIRIEEDEMQNAVDNLLGDIILKDHDNTCDSAIGRVTSTELAINEKTGMRCAKYEGWIDSDEQKLISKINKGIIDSTSIGFSYEPYCGICGRPLEECNHFIWDDGFEIIAKNIAPHELSIVSVPADKNATVSTSFSATETLSEKLIELKEQKRQQEGENNMDFEEKYSELEAEFTEFKESAKTELEELKAEHEAKISDKIEETLSIKQELEKAQEALAEANSELEVLKAEMAKIAEEKLSELRAKVTELNEKVSAGLTEEEISELSESGLHRYVDMFTKIIEAQPSFEPAPQATHQYSKGEDELSEDASTLEKLMHKREQL